MKAFLLEIKARIPPALAGRAFRAGVGGDARLRYFFISVSRRVLGRAGGGEREEEEGRGGEEEGKEEDEVWQKRGGRGEGGGMEGRGGGEGGEDV